MIDLHTHTLLSDGVLLPSELVRRAAVKGYKAIALTDHVDFSNIDFVLPRLVKACKVLNRHWNIVAIPGAEITHAPLEEIAPLVKLARRLGGRIVIVHGETISEPVLSGTNRRGIEAGCDILAHPGKITKADARLAAGKGTCLEITTRKSHSASNSHVIKMAKLAGARMVLNTDSHAPCDLVSDREADSLLRRLGLGAPDIKNIYKNSTNLIKKAG